MSFVWSYEFFHEVAKHLCFVELRSLGLISTVHNRFFKREMSRGWIRQEMAKFFAIPESQINALCKMMKDFGGVMSGSSLLQFLYKENWPRQTKLEIFIPTWNEHDLLIKIIKREFADNQRCIGTLQVGDTSRKARTVTFLLYEKLELHVSCCYQLDVKRAIIREFDYNILLNFFDGTLLTIQHLKNFYCRNIESNVELDYNFHPDVTMKARRNQKEVRMIKYMHRGFNFVGFQNNLKLNELLEVTKKIDEESVRILIEAQEMEVCTKLEDLIEIFRCKNDEMEKILHELIEKRIIFEVNHNKTYMSFDRTIFEF
jgi:hypothetical protein